MFYEFSCVRTRVFCYVGPGSGYNICGLLLDPVTQEVQMRITAGSGVGCLLCRTLFRLHKRCRCALLLDAPILLAVPAPCSFLLNSYRFVTCCMSRWWRGASPACSPTTGRGGSWSSWRRRAGQSSSPWRRAHTAPFRYTGVTLLLSGIPGSH